MSASLHVFGSFAPPAVPIDLSLTYDPGVESVGVIDPGELSVEDKYGPGSSTMSSIRISM